MGPNLQNVIHRKPWQTGPVPKGQFSTESRHLKAQISPTIPYDIKHLIWPSQGAVHDLEPSVGVSLQRIDHVLMLRVFVHGLYLLLRATGQHPLYRRTGWGAFRDGGDC